MRRGDAFGVAFESARGRAVLQFVGGEKVRLGRASQNWGEEAGKGLASAEKTRTVMSLLAVNTTSFDGNWKVK